MNGERKLEILRAIFDLADEMYGSVGPDLVVERRALLANARADIGPGRESTGEWISEDLLIDGLWEQVLRFADFWRQVADKSSDLWEEIPSPTAAANAARQAGLQQHQARARELKASGLKATQIGRRMALDEGRVYLEATADRAAGELYPYEPRQVRRWLNGEN